MTVDVRWAVLTAAHSGLLHLLSPLERERVASLARPADRGRSMLAAALLRVASAESLRCPPEAVVVDRTCTECGGPHGAPRIVHAGARVPHVSVSHSGLLVVVALSPQGPVGVDVQRVGDLADPGTAPQWVRSEALVKARTAISGTDAATRGVHRLDPPLAGYAAALAGPRRALRTLSASVWDGAVAPAPSGTVTRPRPAPRSAA
ncbi:MAG: hypothetical protein QJR09_14170 [Micrococcus sp.]|nr:hypothetical protein [Micrococcus sp.]